MASNGIRDRVAIVGMGCTPFGEHWNKGTDDLLIDAAGPFQGSDLSVPRACIDLGIPYLDLADARDFVGRIATLDGRARAAGVAIVSGASSLPALSGAVARHLADGLDRVHSVDIALSAANRTSGGASVVTAALSYLGQPLKLWRGQRWTSRHGWQELRREDFRLGDGSGLRGRLVALADVPDLDLLPDRLPAVLAVVYLIFNEGYGGRGDLSDDAVRLGRALAELMPDEPEVHGLLAMMLLHDARREARFRDGDLVLLADQDRALWDVDRIDEGRRMLERAARLRRVGPYQLQAAIAAAHATDETDWFAVATLYGALARLAPSPIVELNRAVAVAMASGPDEGLRLIAEIEGLDEYHLLHAARADLLRRLDRLDEAAAAYERAMALATNPVERSFLERRLSEVA